MYTFTNMKRDSQRAIAGYKARKRVRNGRAYSNAIQILGSLAPVGLAVQAFA